MQIETFIMCGRFNIIDDPLAKITSALLDIDFKTQSNTNVCPSELINAVTKRNGNYIQLDANWGIKPSWSKKLLINAQAETVSQKKSFKDAFHLSRCIIPFSGWYEWQSIPHSSSDNAAELWKTKSSTKKQKYLLDREQTPLFMAAIYYEQTDNTELLQNSEFELVTLTTKATKECENIHNRMPLLIEQGAVKQWLSDDIGTVHAILKCVAKGLNYVKVA